MKSKLNIVREATGRIVNNLGSSSLIASLLAANLGCGVEYVRRIRDSRVRHREFGQKAS